MADQTPKKSWWQEMMGIKTDEEVAADTAARKAAMERLKGMADSQQKSDRQKTIDQLQKDNQKGY